MIRIDHLTNSQREIGIFLTAPLESRTKHFHVARSPTLFLYVAFLIEFAKIAYIFISRFFFPRRTYVFRAFSLSRRSENRMKFVCVRGTRLNDVQLMKWQIGLYAAKSSARRCIGSEKNVRMAPAPFSTSDKLSARKNGEIRRCETELDYARRNSSLKIHHLN